MTELAQPAAEAVVTPVVDTQAPTPATTETPVAEALAPETAETETKTEQLRDAEGKFLPKNPRVEKLQAVINEKTREKHELTRETARLRKEYADLQKQLAEKPNIPADDFAAQNSYEVKRALKEERLEETARRVQAIEQSSQQVSADMLAAQVEALREHIPDIQNIYAAPEHGGPMISNVVGEAIARSENGALVAYHLMKNPRDATRLAMLDPMSALIEVGKIAASVKPPAVKRVSQAPQPVQTVSGSPGNPTPDLAALDFKAYEKLMNERELARR